MTREEAIRRLKNMAWLYGSVEREPHIEAIDMAIEALSERPKGEWKCMADCGVTECDQCGWNVEEYVGDYNFCPNCGARMESNE